MNLETTIDRRPMAARDHTLFVRSAAALARAGVTPNAISIIGMLLGITGGLLLARLSRPASFLTIVFAILALFLRPFSLRGG